MESYRITVVLPCYGRPLRTIRAIENILAQSMNNWEAFVIGDGCSDFQKLIDSGEAERYKSIAESTGNKLHIFNLDQNYGGCGYHIINYALENAKGKFFIFCGNDDIILPTHFENYLSGIEHTDVDLAYYNTWVTPRNSLRSPILQASSIGHSEIIVRTETARPFKHSSRYGHDWEFIQNFINNNLHIRYIDYPMFTYNIMHIPGLAEEQID